NPRKVEPTAPPAPRVKLTYKDQRDYELLPKQIEQFEAAIVRDEAALADPDLYAKEPAAFDRLMKAIEATRAQKEAAEHRWLELAEQVEALG
ncbi:MAG: ABC transporter C-terminal domain-containing protein, partial [Sphingomonas sp.]